MSVSEIKGLAPQNKKALPVAEKAKPIQLACLFFVFGAFFDAVNA